MKTIKRTFRTVSVVAFSALWLVPVSLRQMLLLVVLSWSVPLYDFSLGLSVRPAWVIPALFIPAMIMVIVNKGRERRASYAKPGSTQRRGVTSKVPQQEGLA